MEIPYQEKKVHVSYHQRQGNSHFLGERCSRFATFMDRGGVMKNRGSAITLLLRSACRPGVSFRRRRALALSWGMILSFGTIMDRSGVILLLLLRPARKPGVSCGRRREGMLRCGMNDVPDLGKPDRSRSRDSASRPRLGGR